MKTQINSEIKKNLEPAKFPYLGLCQGADPFIVLFFADGTGAVVWSENKSIGVGLHSNNWIPNDFIVFKGTITLSND